MRAQGREDASKESNLNAECLTMSVVDAEPGTARAGRAEKRNVTRGWESGMSVQSCGAGRG